MAENKRCQSCGIPLTKGVLGTEEDGSASLEYCTYCYRNGAFTKPNITMDEMVRLSIRHLTKSSAMSDEAAEHMAKNIIPTLRRWRKNAPHE